MPAEWVRVGQLVVSSEAMVAVAMGLASTEEWMLSKAVADSQSTIVIPIIVYQILRVALTDFQMRHMTKWVSLIDPINYTFPLRPAGYI
jgi:hypothetical protein